ncbi:cell division protein FtsQ/DivIB [Candidatus Thioglobus sp.]|nr:cell division protein FtsQ/DivIB [Candidatus Thioglobus sp.]MDB3893045.1 cell division protein FtsQ/DivIB [Candidatus Thioglobus sp.]MDC0388610.1 cell division protein FtsQ/DivIB [Candidatus Thioglobus sp.]MDC0903991.1 cell division protein FtsQ/DivIB [Candidatus Thioglobus sp.]MDC0920379.1 cell division protein FtsQ/DivIB [Candidatus Thioglobus sp.]
MKLKSKNQHRRSLFQYLKLLLWPLIFTLVVSIIVWTNYHYNSSEILKISVNWEIDRDYLVNKETFEKQIESLTNKPYQLDLHGIKDALERHPWVQEANVKRLFWDTIQIGIITHPIAAYWENLACNKPLEKENCQGYITTQGSLIKPENLYYQRNDQALENLVVLKSGHQPEQYGSLLEDYRTYQLILSDLKILTLTRSNIDQLTLKPNITVVLGYNKQQQRLKDFVKIYHKLRQKIPLRKLNKATYDMRYPKGFTLKY